MFALEKWKLVIIKQDISLRKLRLSFQKNLLYMNNSNLKMYRLQKLHCWQKQKVGSHVIWLVWLCIVNILR